MNVVLYCCVIASWRHALLGRMMGSDGKNDGIRMMGSVYLYQLQWQVALSKEGMSLLMLVMVITLRSMVIPFNFGLTEIKFQYYLNFQFSINRLINPAFRPNHRFAFKANSSLIPKVTCESMIDAWSVGTILQQWAKGNIKYHQWTQHYVIEMVLPYICKSSNTFGRSASYLDWITLYWLEFLQIAYLRLILCMVQY